MNSAHSNRRKFVEQLADENRESYGTPDGRGTLRALELTFEHRWVYLFELVQNALDAGAHSISLRVGEDGDALTFQHDGDQPLRETDVVGLSKVFQSTKGATSVGFMGIGFKSVFMRFREARISGWDWSFRYNIKQVVGEEYGDVQPDMLGAVLPIWDDAIVTPEHGFTTRFELRRRMDLSADLKLDLSRLLSDGDLTPLAILAASQLERFDVNGLVWELGVSEESDGRLEATALSENKNLLWRLFPVEFEPSKESVACFLEHRRIQPSSEESEDVYADASRPRRVLGVLPLDNDGVPKPPARGRVYATLPTEVTLPFGLHINADWLLNISRSGLREIKENSWQRDIVARIADILVKFLNWTADTFTDCNAAKAAFAGISLPSQEADGLESLLADENWLSRLRDRLMHASVFPVWSEKVGALGFATAKNTLVPPSSLANAFRRQPELHPLVLLNGPVLREDVLGPGALKLLRKIGLLTEMSRTELESLWKCGLEGWWQALSGKQANRPHLLFRIWAAVAELNNSEGWRNAELRCVRTANGKWVPVAKLKFLNEALPSSKEPGGPEMREFVMPFVPVDRLKDEWVSILRQPRPKEAEREIMLRAWHWIDEHASVIRLRDIVGDAVNSLVASPKPNWSVLVSLGQWARHRNRADVLTYVLVDTKNGTGGVPIGEALLADPYVERGGVRRCLFPTIPGVSAAYFNTDQSSASSTSWRTFFEETSVNGRLEVRALKDHASRWQEDLVAEFLGLDADSIYEANDSGYTLLDYDIFPRLPDSDSPKELTSAISDWIDDGRNVLIGTGRRKCTYFYRTPYSKLGNVRSTWVSKLSKLAWVPCGDTELRRPRDVLPKPDPARNDAPVAQLSAELISILDQEGVEFGTAVPMAGPLHRLSKLGCQLDAEELSQLLSECRGRVSTDRDRLHFKETLRKLTVPFGNHNRVPLTRIVGGKGGILRGLLGGWIVPLNQIEEPLRTELQHLDFPLKLPNTTSGNQALDYVRDVWERSRSTSQTLASEIRDVLPTAYDYCLADCDSDSELSQRWDNAASHARIFTEGSWIDLTGASDIYFDDIDDRRFFPNKGNMRFVTAGHLGRSRSEQLRTANALGLRLLSSCVKIEWDFGTEVNAPRDWHIRFDLIYVLLRHVRGRRQDVGNDLATESGTKFRLIYVDVIALNVSIADDKGERVPVNARLHEGILHIAGTPVQFASDGAKELLHSFSFGQRGDLAADLTGMLGAINSSKDFALATDKFRRAFAQDFEIPKGFLTEEYSGDRANSEDETSETADGAGTNRKTGTTDSRNQADTTSTTEGGNTEPPKTRESENIEAFTSDIDNNNESDSTGGKYPKGRAFAKQNYHAEQLRKTLKGEITTSNDKEGSNAGGEISRNLDGQLGDEEYRRIAAQYESDMGREPQIGNPNQTGWDIRSTDPTSGEVRLIEVKGKGCRWDDDEVVELGRAQVRKAIEVTEEPGKESWYLYVVEKDDSGLYQVLPIVNPVDAATKWILTGKSWRMMATKPKYVDDSLI